MAAHGKSGLGTTLSWDGNVVSDITKIGGVEISVDTLETTTLDSIYKEFVSGIPDAGSVDIEGNFYPGDTNGQIALKDAVGGALKECVITLPSAFASSWTFTGMVTKFKTGEADKEGIVPFSASIKISGMPVLAITASTGLTSTYFSISESAVITPDPAGDVYEYVATVLTTVDSVTVTPIATSGTITVNGNVVSTGQASTPITLGEAGSVTKIVIEVVETNKMPKTYTIYLSRA